MPYYFGNNIICDCIDSATYFDSSLSPDCKDHFRFLSIILFMFPAEGNTCAEEGVTDRKLEESAQLDA